MKPEDMKLLLNYLKDKNDLNEEMTNLLNRIELVCKQILIQENFQKDMEEITEKLEKLK
ncbi:MAG: hypothetical protein MJ232_04900 [archaeon]|nr:hypothetical protein [archaeon]